MSCAVSCDCESCTVFVFFIVEILLGWLNNSTEYDVLDFFSILE